MKRYLDFLSERLGVPDGNIESAEILYDFILKSIKNRNTIISNGQPNNEFIHTEIGDISLKVADLEINNIKVELGLLPNDEYFSILGMSVAMEPSSIESNKIRYNAKDCVDDGNNIRIEVKYSIINNKTTYHDIYHDFYENKSEMVGCLAHELKHIYDKFTIGRELFGDISSYSTFSNKRFGIPTIDRFIYNLYLLTKTESLVRSTEVYGEIKSLDISKDVFRSFLKNNRLYNELKLCSNFSFSEMKSDLYNEIDIIKSRLKESGINIPNNDDDVIDLLLELTYTNIVGESISKLSSIMRLDDPIMRFIKFKTGDEDIKYYNKYVKKNTFKNKEKYFEYCEKLFKFESNKVLKKISKLYDMCKDVKANKLHSDITNKSIINPKLHDKLVADKTIKTVESYSSFFKKK